MKTITIIILAQFLFICNGIAQKIDLVNLLKSIDWNRQDTKLYNSLKNNIEKCDSVKMEEGVSSEYKFKDVFIENQQLTSEPIRINNKTKKIYRINFIINSNNRNNNIESKIYNYISTNWENNIENINEEKESIIKRLKSVLTKEYLLNFLCVTIQDNKDYIISIEPLSYYEVEQAKAKILQNSRNIPIPQIESFAKTLNNQIIIKEKNKGYKIYNKNKLYHTPKGDIIFFKNGMISFRPDYSNIIYGLDSLIMSYPIKK